MSDECLITLETVFLFYIVYQAVMRKFTLAGKTICINDITMEERYETILKTFFFFFV